MAQLKSETPMVSVDAIVPESDDRDQPLVVAEKTASVSGLPVRVHVDARGVSLALMALVAVVFSLQWAQKFFIPVIFGIFISYTLNPVVSWLERFRLPRLVATSVVILTILGSLVAVGTTLNNEFQSIVEQLPTTTHRLSKALSRMRDDQPGTIQQMQAAADELTKATNQATGIKTATSKNSAPAVSEPSIRFTELLWAGSLGAIGFLSQAVMVLFLVFFVLLSGDTFKRKLVKLTSGSISNKKITVQILDAMHDSIQSYMFMLLVTNCLLALLMWGALRWLGLENAGAWAVAAGLLHVIPYFGPMLIMGSTGLVAFMQFESFSSAVLVAGTSLAIATVVGTFVTTWMTGRIAKMNATAVFVALLFWGWLWGIWGLLLGIPIVVIIKVVAEHVDGMQTIAELLGE